MMGEKAFLKFFFKVPFRGYFKDIGHNIVQIISFKIIFFKKNNSVSEEHLFIYYFLMIMIIHIPKFALYVSYF